MVQEQRPQHQHQAAVLSCRGRSELAAGGKGLTSPSLLLQHT